ncbi:UNKNOWN [Stylonychia lemnae]|uniref:Uncharacterized protein n=1 Tax=Stylonychia lemnae TaxID=5949 RepID=A0A078B6P9_STYLE|nr:UNKNOWN [Stylonychia lemnae]|eukprot:CDW89871.1 UNKNOWN [Stylonychia lemnae]
MIQKQYANIERKLTSISKNQKPSENENKLNRHALPDDVRQIVSPKKVIPMSRRDSFTLLKRQLEKQPIKTAKTQVQSPAQGESDLETGGIALDDTDEWINNYYSGLMLLDEQFQNRLQMAKQKGFQHSGTMMNKSLLGSPRKGQNSTKVTFGDSVNGSPHKDADSFSQAFNFDKSNYKDIGEKYMLDLREQTRRYEHDQFVKKIQSTNENGETNLKALSIMEMTPAQKQEFLLQRKLQQKKAQENGIDPLKSLILEQKESACSAFVHSNTRRSNKNSNHSSPVNILSVAAVLSQPQKEINLGLAKETQAYTQVFKQTFSDYRKLNKLYENEKLKEKLKERGSLYGVPSTVYSQEKEIQELISKMPPMITKPNSLLNGGEIDKKYQIFQEKTKQIYEEADEELYGDNSQIYKNKNNSFTDGTLTKKRHDNNLNTYNQDSNSGELPQLRNQKSSQSHNFPGTSPNATGQSQIAHVIKIHQNHQLTVGKPKKQLATSLDLKEREFLKQCIYEETFGYKDKIEKKFHDKFNWSIMMDPDSTKTKNEIMREIKIYQMKQRNLPNFIRKKREEILSNVNNNETNYLQRSMSTDVKLEQNGSSFLQDIKQPNGTKLSQKYNQIQQQNEIDECQLKEEFVDYVKEILTKTSGAANQTSGKKKQQKITQKSLTEDIAQFLKDGLENKKQALNSVTIPDILRSQIRKDGLVNKSYGGSSSKNQAAVSQ